MVGAGPAGLACASMVEGKVLLIEKENHPYNRISCAEWVPVFLHVPYIQKTDGMLTIYPGGEVYSAVKGKVIDRVAWQEEWLSSLECEVHTGEKVLSVEDGLVRTNKGKYITEWVCVASGPGRRIEGLSPQRGCLPAVNLQFRVVKPFEFTVVWFTEAIKHGYAWCFPKGDIANVGMGMRGRIGSMVETVIDFFKGRGFIKGEPLRFTAGLIPQETPYPSGSGKVVLAGDAGGFTDPLTGAGIASALDTGRLAGKLVSEKISREAYERELERTYIPFLERRLERKHRLEENGRI